ncbi:MAG: type I methionyl aminopeptidase [Candidatus Omnitrophica bacterium]|nr:type I methionyl aminopeptidase [Candidatus Omnitrophota bacterium]
MIELKSRREIEIMSRAGKITAALLDYLEKAIRPGIRTLELDELADEFIRSHGAQPAFKGYRGYPRTICVSVNEEVVHGIPGQRRLEEGDIVSIDVGVKLDGYYSDAAKTFAVGSISEAAKRLMRVTREALELGMQKAKQGARLSDISWTIQQHVEQNHFGVVRQFVGHGIGAQLHEEPQVPNFGSPNQGVLLKEGMVLAIEPMVSEGHFEVEILEDGWTAVTKDRKLAAHFEHTVAVTPEGPRILTQ